MDTKRKQQPDARNAASVHDQTPTPIPEGEDRDTLLNYYHQMVLIRHFEEKAGEMYTKARIGGYCHLNLGEEATVAGFCAGLESTDYVYTNYREHGYAICRGISPNAVMAELFGKETGCSHGRGGSMHLFDLARRFMGGYAIVGGELPLATGSGANPRVAIEKHIDDLWDLLIRQPDRNLPPYSTQIAMSYPYVVPGGRFRESYYWDSYFMLSERVDGNDVLAVRNAMRNAAKIAREQHEPSLIEAISYRFRGHSVVDPDRYRDQEEVRKGREQDPITAFASRLMAAGLLDEQEAHEIDEQVQQEVDAAVKFADESPNPSVEEFMHGLQEYVYAPDDASMPAPTHANHLANDAGSSTAVQPGSV